MITHKSSRRRESSLLDDFALQILRGVYPERSEWAQNDSQGLCHSERSEESLADLWVITRTTDCCGGGGWRVFFALDEVKSCGFEVSALKNWLLSEGCGGLSTHRIFAAR